MKNKELCPDELKIYIYINSEKTKKFGIGRIGDFVFGNKSDWLEEQGIDCFKDDVIEQSIWASIYIRDQYGLDVEKEEDHQKMRRNGWHPAKRIYIPIIEITDDKVIEEQFKND